MENKLRLRTNISRPLTGTIRAPGDKSISHRSLIFAALSIGTTKISGILESKDIMVTITCLKNMGVKIFKKSNYWIIIGVGVGGLQKPLKILNFGNSGTSSRLMMGVLATHGFDSYFTGDKSLCSRPMKRVINPLIKIGASIKGDNNNKMPFIFSGTDNPIPIKYILPIASAQVKSAILLAGLNIRGETIIHEPIITRNHTELMMIHFGVDIKVIKNKIGTGNLIKLTGPVELLAKDVIIPTDLSSAAFPIVAALLTPDSDIIVEAVMVNSTRFGLINVLIKMGANILFLNKRVEGGEVVVDFRVKYSQLKGVVVTEDYSSIMIDEYPILAIAASYASGETKMLGLKELRVKESDRLSVIANGLKANGVICKEGNDWLIINGGKVKGGAIIDTKLDHRIAMSFLVLGFNSEESIEINDYSVISTSFPTFIKDMIKLGANFN